MRTLCLMLLLANALFLGWSQFIDIRVTDLQRRPAATARPPRIVLAREAPLIAAPKTQKKMPTEPVRAESFGPLAARQPVAAVPQPREPARAPAIVCTSVGPFAEAAEAAAAGAALQAAGFKPRQRVVQGEVWVGYWVSVQHLASREDTGRALKLLTDKDINDVYVIPGTEGQSALSLGVFSDRQRAQRRVEEVRALGLEPSIGDRKRAGVVHWIDVDQPEPVQPVDTSLFQSDPGKIMRLELRACPTGAVG